MGDSQDKLYPHLLPDADLLNELEIKTMSAEYKEYYKSRKQNFLAIIERFPMLWQFYDSLDTIVLNEFSDVENVTDINRMFPVALFLNSHAKIRLSIELAFAGCLSEARSLMRDAIEFVAHAHSMFRDANLQKVWLEKNEEIQAFKDAFERNKKTGIFNGLPELQSVWGDLSETGSHSTINAICERFVIAETEKQISYRLNYCGVEEQIWIPSLFSLLLNFSAIEKVIYEDLKERLQFDNRLSQRRQRNEVLKEQLRLQIILRYDIQPPDKTPQ